MDSARPYLILFVSFLSTLADRFIACNTICFYQLRMSVVIVVRSQCLSLSGFVPRCLDIACWVFPQPHTSLSFPPLVSADQFQALSLYFTMYWISTHCV